MPLELKKGNTVNVHYRSVIYFLLSNSLKMENNLKFKIKHITVSIWKVLEMNSDDGCTTL